jgi:hypothetical protein
MRVRFVVLHHRGVNEPHFDLMLAVPGEDKLMTWRVKNGPNQWQDGGEIGAVRIEDHRAVYMTYEGPISGGRGEVKRVREGAAHVVAEREGTVVIDIHLAGRTRIQLPLS